MNRSVSEITGRMLGVKVYRLIRYMNLLFRSANEMCYDYFRHKPSAGGSVMKKDFSIDLANIILGIFAIFCFGVVFLPKVENYIPLP